MLALEAVFGVLPDRPHHKDDRVEGKNRIGRAAARLRGTVTFKRIYDLRSTFASQALAAGVSVFELARIMGTSVRMIERHYGSTVCRAPVRRSSRSLDALPGSFGPRVGHGRGGQSDRFWLY